MKIKLVMASLSFPFLAGCATLTGANTQDDFLCEAQIGSPCATIAQVDGGSSEATVAIQEHEGDQLYRSSAKPEGEGLNASYQAYDGAEYRVPELVSELWIAPYLDGNNILHESRVIHFVLREASWKRR